jgi:hypothetical protein
MKLAGIVIWPFPYADLRGSLKLKSRSYSVAHLRCVYSDRDALITASFSRKIPAADHPRALSKMSSTHSLTAINDDLIARRAAVTGPRRELSRVE